LDRVLKPRAEVTTGDGRLDRTVHLDGTSQEELRAALTADRCAALCGLARAGGAVVGGEVVLRRWKLPANVAGLHRALAPIERFARAFFN
jgi:hypothetical protein